MNTKSKKSGRKVEVTWKRAERPIKPATIFSGARPYSKTTTRGAVAKAVMQGVKAQPAKSKKVDPERERLATASAVRKVLKSNPKSKKGTQTMNKKSKKVAQSKAKARPQYDEPKLRKAERAAALARLDRRDAARKLRRNEPEGKVVRQAAASRMKKTLENYPKNPKVGERVWEYDESKKVKGKGGGKKGKGRRNQAGTAADRKAAAKALRIAAREERARLKEEAKAERLAARVAKQQAREEAKRLKNLPGLMFTNAMLKDVMSEFKNNVDGKIGDRRLERLAKQAQRLSEVPLKKIKTRIRNMQNRIRLMEAICVVGKAALDDGYNKFMPAKTKKKGPKGFGRKAADSKEAAPKKSTKKATVSKANGSIATAAVKTSATSKGRLDRAAAAGAALAMKNRRAPRGKK